MAKKRRGDPAGFAEGVPVRARAGGAAPIDIQGLLDAILAKRRMAEDQARAAERRAEVERRAAEAARAARFKGWIKARTQFPDIYRSTTDHYRTAILAYVERALPSEAATAGPACRLCGRHVREVDQP